MDAFIFIWRIRFLLYKNLRMGSQKIFVVKRNVANNSQTICDDAKDVTKMTIDV